MPERSWYVDFADRHVGHIAAELEQYFEDLGNDLILADMNMTLHEYLSMTVLSSVAVFGVFAVMLTAGMGLMAGTTSGWISAVIIGLFVGVFLAFYLYPSVQVGRRRSNIENNLPFATMYLSTVAGTGTPPAALFELLGEFDEYGEVSDEARNISRDIYTFGAGTTEALRGAAKRTPSDKFKELLWGINSILTTGGDLRAYLQEKSESFMQDYRRSLDEFTDTLSLLVEMYI
ncbi:MAG: type II secretion system F family protein, partial [Candidatus Nanohaloarchaea archaeon]